MGQTIYEQIIMSPKIILFPKILHTGTIKSLNQCTFLYVFLLKWVCDNEKGVFQAAFCNLPMFIWNGLALKILYNPQNYRPYLGFGNIYILSTNEQDISLNCKYYPEQCPTLLSTVYWDNGAGCNINDTWVQSHVSFILLELGERCIVPPW